MFINLSNHPSSKWSKEQLNAAGYSKPIDMAFPQISADATQEEVAMLAKEYRRKIGILIDNANANISSTVVLVQGEFTFTACLVSLLQDWYIKCVAATSERNTVENEDGSKVVRFSFVQFREYC